MLFLIQRMNQHKMYKNKCIKIKYYKIKDDSYGE